MNRANPKVDNYLAVGCGRCPLGGTPDCKVHPWQEEMTQLRRILLDTELTEELKWSVPCYTIDGRNVIILSAFKNYCALNFFKGVLLKDVDNILVAQTENMQATRQIRFTDVDSIVEMEQTLKAYIEEAIQVEKDGLKVEYKTTAQLDFPDELLSIFEDDPTYAAAFEDLTPGRQRGYLLHFSGAKQSKTRVSRIEKCMSKIFEGKGLHDR
jgi:uncharacterized protein YdeI (YjbR/CyaY-like superfamily)